MKSGKVIFLASAQILAIIIFERQLSWIGFLLSMLLLIRLILDKQRMLLLGVVSLILFITFASYQINTHRLLNQHINAEQVQGVLQIDPYDTKVDGDSYSGKGNLKYNNQIIPIFFTYQCQAEREKQELLAMDSPYEIHVSGRVSLLEGARYRYGFHYQNYGRARGISQHLKVSQLDTLQLQKDWISQVKTFRNGILNRIQQEEQYRTTQYILALLFGQKKWLHMEIIQDFKNLGILHLLAISGMHISLLMEIAFYCLWRIGITKETSFPMVILGLVGYAFLLGWSVSVSRAVCMGILFIIGNWHPDWKINNLDRLSWTSLFFLLINPLLIYDLGYQLSYGMTLMVIVVEIALQNQPYSLKRKLIELLLVLLGSIPILSLKFYEVNWIAGFLTILLTIGLARVVMPLLLIQLFLIFSPFQGLRDLFSFFSDWIFSNMEWGIHAMSVHIPSKIMIGHGYSIIWFIYYLLFMVLLLLIEGKRLSIRCGIIFLFLSSFLILLQSYHFREEVIFIDVGQGDATLFIQKGWNKAVLIDTGGEPDFYAGKEGWKSKAKKSSAQKTIIPALKSEGISKLPIVFLTHSDFDHMGNLPEISQEVAIQAVIVAQGMEETKPVLEAKSKMSGKEQWRSIQAPVNLYYQKLNIVVLGPQQRSDGENASSLIMNIKSMNHQWMMMGDSGQEQERELLFQNFVLKADVLKAGHHGSKHSTSLEWLEAVLPHLVVFSCGKNNQFKHPHEETRERLIAKQIPFVRTDLQGSLYFHETKKGLEVYQSMNESRQAIRIP